jgi:hypothetical protein
MAKVELFNMTAEKSSSKTVGETIKNKPAMERATRENPDLIIAIAEAGRKVSNENEIDENILRRIIEADPELKLAAKESNFKKELSEFFGDIKDNRVVVGGNKLPTPGGSSDVKPGGGSPEAPSVGVSNAQNERLLALLNAIPYAYPGKIITDDHHNSLRQAVRFLASLLDDAAESEVFMLNFAPYLRPDIFVKNRQTNFDWEVIYDKASIPDELPQSDDDIVISGAFAVQLPDDALIRQMTVRGEGAFEQTKSPKSFKVNLFSQPLDGQKRDQKNDDLITVNLTEKRGVFKVTEKPSAEDEQRVDNSAFQYFVEAVWEGSFNTRKFEISSLQIICER